MNEVPLTPLKSELTIEELQEYDLGEIVEVDGDPGIIAGFVEEPFEFPVGDSENEMDEVGEDEEISDEDMEEIDASTDNPYYIVALQDGGSVAVTADEISEGSLTDDEGKDIDSWEQVGAEGTEAELAGVYEYMDDPNDPASLAQAKADYLRDQHDLDSDEYGSASCEELVNIPGVDDPHVGFDSMPNGWTRKSVLQAWASLGGMWRTCYARMVREMGPNFAKRWCAALKDEVLQTEEWRNSF